ncbi:hypothetical protein K502DRAFT_365975 [Neoconidiobolus thromboides FSU 785]|nr:hypothetical protein K502DRAFT_365975 [Neoconidiobolus thromboides FSU 785]
MTSKSTEYISNSHDTPLLHFSGASLTSNPMSPQYPCGDQEAKATIIYPILKTGCVIRSMELTYKKDEKVDKAYKSTYYSLTTELMNEKNQLLMKLTKAEFELWYTNYNIYYLSEGNESNGYKEIRLIKTTIQIFPCYTLKMIKIDGEILEFDFKSLNLMCFSWGVYNKSTGREVLRYENNYFKGGKLILFEDSGMLDVFFLIISFLAIHYEPFRSKMEN